MLTSKRMEVPCPSLPFELEALCQCHSKFLAAAAITCIAGRHGTVYTQDSSLASSAAIYGVKYLVPGFVESC
jgi:hypothetical protein